MMIRFTLIFVISFILISFSVSASTTTTTTGLTSLTLSNLYTSLSYDYVVLRVTGVGDTIASLTIGYRQTFDFGYVYVGFGSIPGTSINLNSPDWFDSVVWQAEVNINLKKVGDAIDRVFKNNNNNTNNNSTTK